MKYLAACIGGTLAARRFMEKKVKRALPDAKNEKGIKLKNTAVKPALPTAKYEKPKYAKGKVKRALGK